MEPGKREMAIAAGSATSPHTLDESASRSTRADGKDSSAISPISSRLPGRFIPELQRASRRLDLPEDLKREILLEMAADLEDLSRRLREMGLGVGDADREAIRRLGLGDDATSALSDVHLSPLERALRRGATLARAGRDLLLIGLGLLLVLSPLPLLARTAQLGDVLGQLWPIAILLLLAARDAFQLRGELTSEQLDHDRAHERLTRLLLAAALTMAAAGLISTTHAYREAGVRAATAQPFGQGLIQVAAGASLRLSIGLAAGLAILALWSVSASRLTRRTHAEAPASDIFSNPAGRKR